MAAFTDETFGLVNEGTPGTYTAPTRFYEWSDGSHEWNPNRVQGQGLTQSRRIPASARRVEPSAEGKVEVTVEAISKSMGLLWESCLGVSASTLVSGATYQQNFTMSTGVTLPSRTIQIAGIRADGTVDPFSYVGCTVAEWEFEIAAELATLKATFDATKLDTAQSFASPSYPSAPNLFHRANATVNYGGSPTAPTTTAVGTGGTAVTNVRRFNIKGDNGLATDRYNLIGTKYKSRQLTQIPALTGELEVEYTDVTMRDAFIADTDNALYLTITAGALSAGSETLQVYLPRVRFDGSMPSRAGGELNVFTLPFTALYDGTNTPITVVHRTADTAI